MCTARGMTQGGVTITEFQAQSGARIQLSRSREFFPGTGDRILLLTGTVNAILTALHLILSKLLAEEPAGACMLLTNSCCGDSEAPGMCLPYRCDPMQQHTCSV